MTWVLCFLSFGFPLKVNQTGVPLKNKRSCIPLHGVGFSKWIWTSVSRTPHGRYLESPSHVAFLGNTETESQSVSL